MRRLGWLALWGVVSAVWVAGCTTSTGGKSQSALAGAETDVAKALISDDQENQLGDQVYAQLQQQGTRFITDPAVTGYVQGISDKLFALARKDRPGVNWRVLVIDDPKTVNAFSTPGGRLYVYSGLLQSVGDDAELAGVMGHEIGHEVAHHVARNLVAANGLEAIASLAVGKNPGLAKQLAASVLTNGSLLAFSRRDETEADEYGARYSSAAGYDPQGLVTFFGKLEKLQGNTPGVMKYLSDHPLTSDRIDHIKSYIAANHLTGGHRDAQQLAMVKARLGSAPGMGSSAGQTAPPQQVPNGTPSGPTHGPPHLAPTQPPHANPSQSGPPH